jgi:DNA-binding transcriptional MocR family regulator
VKAITADIETGAMKIGERLPVQRVLAEILGVSVQTVQSAYKELERQGFIRCDVGRGSFVAARVSDSMSNFILDTADRVRMDFSTGRIIHTPLHDAEWQRACADLAKLDEQPWIHVFRPIVGLERHRRAGVTWLQTLKMAASPENLLVTNGGEHALFVALASVAKHGDVVLTEALTDHGIIGAANILGFTLKGVEIDEYGIRPAHFEEMCDTHRITALVCAPTLHKPTGSVLSEHRRQTIAKIAERYGVYVIEDDVHGPLLEHPQTPIGSLIPELSCYLTAMTECVLTGLRVGYLVVPRRLALRAESVLRVTSWMTSPALAEIATRWILDGTVSRLLAIQRERLATRYEILQEVLGQYTDGQHHQGLSAWLSVPDHWQVNRLVQELSKRDIAVTAPDPFLVRDTDRPSKIRVCIGVEATDAAYRTALETIAEVFAQYPQVHDFV